LDTVKFKQLYWKYSW